MEGRARGRGSGVDRLDEQHAQGRDHQQPPESPWENATVAGGDLAETINKLKAQPGGDMIAYGGSTLVRNLIAKGLLDELHLFVNPTAIGAGMPVFPNGAYQRLRLVTARPFDCGITALHLEPKRA